MMPFAVVIEREYVLVVVSIHPTYEAAKKAVHVCAYKDARVVIRHGYDR